MKVLKLKLSCLSLILAGLMSLTASAQVNQKTQALRDASDNLILANHVCDLGIDGYDDPEDYNLCIMLRGREDHENENRNSSSPARITPNYRTFIENECTSVRPYRGTQKVGVIGDIACRLLAKGDYNDAWINLKRFGNAMLQNSIPRSNVDQYLATWAQCIQQVYGWIPPEYR